jgi:dipeptidyl aminopeptidase/acylaminoacyl peptidase
MNTAAGDKKIAPYGSWKSPITSDLIVAGGIGLGQLKTDSDPAISDTVYWIEVRPSEGGRSVIVRWNEADGCEDVTPPPFNARTRVHEYGGGDYTVYQGTVYFANFADQRLYRQRPGEAPEPITPEGPYRYADLTYDPRANRLFAVREDHSREGAEPANTLVAIALDESNSGQVLVSGSDFYASPRLSPDGQRLAWLSWNHPNMPWDGTELWIADLGADNRLINQQRIAGGRTASIFQPEYAPDGTLVFVSDVSGWWNLYRWREQQGEAEPLCSMEAEFGLPQWVFGMSTYAFAGPGTLICTYTRDGQRKMARFELQEKSLSDLPLPLSGTTIQVAGEHFYFIGGSPAQHVGIVRANLDGTEYTVLRSSSTVEVGEGYLSRAQAIEFPTANGMTAHAYYYPPQNAGYAAPADERPPLIVASHGGPTSSASNTLSIGIQYWTSRGFAFLDVNYGGSTGYGRAYRERLNGNWGVVDVEDCINGARFLADQGLVDPQRMAIRGGSAGGYTTLCAITFHDVFSAAASHFGVSDAEALATDTHKFESRYLDNLIGPYPQRRDIYVERSPIHATDQINCALILFQGLEDKVVPPDQSEKMFLAVRAREQPVAYLAFEGEQHGFRQAQNIKRALDAELYFYSKVYEFPLADPCEPVTIENLD